MQDDFPLLDGAYLANISASELRHILRGNVEVPMFQERFDILHEVGRVLVAEFDGSFVNLIRTAEDDAVALVQLHRRHIGLVPQEPFVFSGPMWDNIHYGLPEATDAQVRQAAMQISNGDWLADDLVRVPLGLFLPEHSKSRVSR